MFPKIFMSLLIGISVLRSYTSTQSLPCKANEKYETCGTACPFTCEFSNPNVGCIAECVRGCFCDQGYIRSRIGGPCIPIHSCGSSLQCEDNEEYSDCATACPLTCDGSGPDACPEVCLLGCVCKEGFIRSSIEGTCIPNATCTTIN